MSLTDELKKLKEKLEKKDDEEEEEEILPLCSCGEVATTSYYGSDYCDSCQEDVKLQHKIAREKREKEKEKRDAKTPPIFPWLDLEYFCNVVLKWKPFGPKERVELGKPKIGVWESLGRRLAGIAAAKGWPLGLWEGKL